MSQNEILPPFCNCANSPTEPWRTRFGGVILSRPVGALAGTVLILIFLGCMSLSFGGLSIGCKTEPDGTVCQEGKVRLRCTEELDVYYPVTYASPPNLEIDGDPDEYELIEQKADHFRIRCKEEGGSHWCWKARGLRCLPGTAPTVVVTPPSPPPVPPPTNDPPSPLPPPTPVQNP